MTERTYPDKCTATSKDGSPCPNRHYSKGLCRKHYVQKQRKDKKRIEPEDSPEDEPSVEDQPKQPDFIPPDEIKIGVPGTPPEGSYIPPNQPSQPQIGPDGKPIPPKPGGPGGTYSFSFGTLQVKLAWEQLSKLAPDAQPLELTTRQEQELDAAFAAAGITINNPWVVIVSIIVPPTVLFIIMHYETIKLNGQKMFKDMARFFAGLNPNKKKEEPERLV
jgi:hypothetical protein